MASSMDRRAFLSLALRGLGACGAALGASSASMALAQGLRFSPRRPREARIVTGDYTGVPRQQVDETDPNVFVLPRLRYRTDGHLGPTGAPLGDENLLGFARRFSNLRISNLPFEERVVDASDAATLAKRPYVFMTTEEDFQFSPEERRNLAEYIRRGGFIYADDCVADPRHYPDIFYRACLREFADIIPGESLRLVPADHPIYHCFYDFPNHAPRPEAMPGPDMGLFHNGRLAVFLTATDIHCGWWTKKHAYCREDTLKMGLNIIIYALTH